MKGVPHVPQLPQTAEKPQKQGRRGTKSCGKRRKSKKDAVWEYMRRNRVFLVGDMMAIFDLNKRYARWLLWLFETNGAIVRVNDTRLPVSEHIYRFVAPYDARAPSSVVLTPEQLQEVYRRRKAKKAQTKKG